VWGIRVLVGRWGWDVESPHVLADSFTSRANKNGCRVSRRKDGECGRGGRNQRIEGGGRWRGESERGKYQDREREAREVKVSAGSSGEDRYIGKGEGHEGELGRAHEMCKRGEDMGSAGVVEDGRRGDRANQGSMMTVVVVEIVRFQRGEGVGVRETRGW
jgi:hypothetical protein